MECPLKIFEFATEMAEGQVRILVCNGKRKPYHQCSFSCKAAAVVIGALLHQQQP